MFGSTPGSSAVIAACSEKPESPFTSPISTLTDESVTSTAGRLGNGSDCGVQAGRKACREQLFRVGRIPRPGIRPGRRQVEVEHAVGGPGSAVAAVAGGDGGRPVDDGHRFPFLLGAVDGGCARPGATLPRVSGVIRFRAFGEPLVVGVDRDAADRAGGRVRPERGGGRLGRLIAGLRHGGFLQVNSPRGRTTIGRGTDRRPVPGRAATCCARRR